MGPHPQIEGLSKTQIECPKARRNSARTALDSDCNSSLGLKPTGPPCEFWTCIFTIV